MTTLRTYKKMLLGKHNNENIYLFIPEWQCGWYWSFGNIGNNNCSYHLDGLKSIETYNFEAKCLTTKNVNLYDGIVEHFGNTLKIRLSDLWTICELIESIYHFKKHAQYLHTGGAHMTTNPCKDIILNLEDEAKINTIILPKLIDEFYKIVEANQNNDALFSKLVSLNLEGNTNIVVDYMLKNNIKTDDLKSIKELSSNDVSVIHSLYWKRFHANNKK